MAIQILNQKGEQVAERELSPSIFGIEPNTHVMHEAVVNYLANQRQGSFANKTRAEVRGGGRKPWKQKGTGRARHGSSRSPIWVGGGVTFAKKPRDFSYTLPRKVRQLALKSALSAKAGEDAIVLLDELCFEVPSTKAMVHVLNNLKVNEKTLVVLEDNDVKVARSISNLPKVKSISVNNINTYTVLNYDKVIFTVAALDKLEEVYQ
ncbi:MAG: 50S ribosomal protein L4 [Tissierellia bacterium]|nr:50S ribosomal protein L4 [Tissierellia bacterium]